MREPPIPYGFWTSYSPWLVGSILAGETDYEDAQSAATGACSSGRSARTRSDSQSQNVTKNYLILANGQGPGSTSFAKSLGPALTANLPNIGVVTAISADPNFATGAAALPGVHAEASDLQIQWLPAEPALQLTGNDVGAQGVNSEPYNGYL